MKSNLVIAFAIVLQLGAICCFVRREAEFSDYDLEHPASAVKLDIGEAVDDAYKKARDTGMVGLEDHFNGQDLMHGHSDDQDVVSAHVVFDDSILQEHIKKNGFDFTGQLRVLNEQVDKIAIRVSNLERDHDMVSDGRRNGQVTERMVQNLVRILLDKNELDRVYAFFTNVLNETVEAHKCPKHF
ncbi:hypothetical protein HDE_01450 [Halotydeus destructor]|nr:hypothetical protein HDE_01450 [Halotydeus destructor]